MHRHLRRAHHRFAQLNAPITACLPCTDTLTGGALNQTCRRRSGPASGRSNGIANLNRDLGARIGPFSNPVFLVMQQGHVAAEDGADDWKLVRSDGQVRKSGMSAVLRLNQEPSCCDGD